MCSGLGVEFMPAVWRARERNERGMGVPGVLLRGYGETAEDMALEKG